ncbi:MAG TPA: hypothetical protein VHW92_03160 [Mycobacteriales bacterium]|nr:hypothetical protein [Mycobacteriales bacterium]
MSRPASLSVAAALVALEAAGMAIFGIVELVRAVVGHPQSRGTAILLGVVVLIYAAGIAAAALGLWRVRRWAQTPTYLVQFFSLVIGIGQLHTLPGLMIPLLVVAVLTLVSVSLPDSRARLGGI